MRATLRITLAGGEKERKNYLRIDSKTHGKF